jgi:hypothetical protein
MHHDVPSFINVRFAGYRNGGLKGTTQHLGNHSKGVASKEARCCGADQAIGDG